MNTVDTAAATYTPTTRPSYGIHSGQATGDDDPNEEYFDEEDEDYYSDIEEEIERITEQFDCESSALHSPLSPSMIHLHLPPVRQHLSVCVCMRVTMCDFCIRLVCSFS